MMERVNRLDIDGPVATCGRCGFSQALDGEWRVEGGTLTWRSHRDPLSGRGPDYSHCCESDHDGEGVISFDEIMTDGAAIPHLQKKLLLITQNRERRPGRQDDGYL